MNLRHLLLSLLFSLCTIVTTSQGYLGEPYPPFTILSPTQGTVIKRGDKVNVTWKITSGIKFPVYGYATASTTQTIVGLVPKDTRRDERYIYKLDNNVKLKDESYEWQVSQDIVPGEYRIGIGFYFHEDSPVIHII